MTLCIVKLFAYICMAYGFSEMIVFGSGPFGIFEKWRNFAFRIGEGFGELFTCMMCLPTWVGLIFSIINAVFFPGNQLTPFHIVFGPTDSFYVNGLVAILDAGFTSGICWFLYRIEEALDRHCTYIDEEVKDGQE